MIRLFVYQYNIDKRVLNTVLNTLQIQYFHILIPRFIKEEFYCKRNDRGRKKRLKKIMKNHPFIIDCPINVSEREINFLNGSKESNAGEADAIIQGSKAKAGEIKHLRFNEVHFLTNDGPAVKRAEIFGIGALPYSSLKAKYKEVGISLPL